MKITKAVVAVAGSGTRFLPATKAIPKEMIPIIDRPIVQYVVEELAEGGVEDVIFVSRWDKKVLEDHFDRHPTLETELAEKHKDDVLSEIQRTGQLIHAAYIRQNGPYGNGTPALNGGRLIDDEAFIYAFGDDLVSATTSFTSQLIEAYAKQPGVILGVQEVPLEEVPMYGMIETDENGRVTKIVEKPAPDAVTSNLVSFGRFVLTQDIVRILDGMPLGKDNELWLMDAIEQYRHDGGAVYACPIVDGEWFTTGDPVTYLRAFFHYAMQRDDLRPEILEIAERLTRENRARENQSIRK